MKLSEFLNRFNGKVEMIIEYNGQEAMKAVESDGYALQYVKDQTEAVCMKAVERNGYALQYVNKSIFENDMVEEKPETIIIDGLTYNKI